MNMSRRVSRRDSHAESHAESRQASRRTRPVPSPRPGQPPMRTHRMKVEIRLIPPHRCHSPQTEDQDRQGDK